MSYITEEAVAAAEQAATEAQHLADQIGASIHEGDWQKQYAAAAQSATAIRVRAEGLRAQRARQEPLRRARSKAESHMKAELRGMWTGHAADIAQLNAATASLAASLQEVRAATAVRNSRIAEFSERLAGAGLLAVDDLTEPGTHHEFGAAPSATGIYLAGILHRPREAISIAVALLAATFGQQGGSAELRTLHQMGRI